jgi:hypothetical protein
MTPSQVRLKLRSIRNRIERRRLDIIALEDEIEDLEHERDQIKREFGDGTRQS